MKDLLRVMISEYKLKGEDFFGYKLSKDNPYTYHHIKKRCHGGKLTRENGAILTKIAHEYLHIIESRDLQLYKYINNVLSQINEQMHEPLERQILAIWYMLEIFEEKHKNDKTAKGKILIKSQYIDERRKNGRIFKIN